MAGEYSDYHIEHITTDKKLAEAYVKLHDGMPDELYIEEFDKQRLAYDVTGPYAPWPEDGSIPIVAPRYFASIDAHTGEIIRTNYK